MNDIKIDTKKELLIKVARELNEKIDFYPKVDIELYGNKKEFLYKLFHATLSMEKDDWKRVSFDTVLIIYSIWGIGMRTVLSSTGNGYNLTYYYEKIFINEVWEFRAYERLYHQDYMEISDEHRNLLEEKLELN